ncbi:MAG: hypothetical protein JRN62_03465 [Nitrososphaerota archaeon]|jgi:hypothetical protein|nr:hypothetical protein [Nitrososphaerota archaeon]MDG6948658.1 hypothetical protein [Nitrososphaerota archaeon]
MAKKPDTDQFGRRFAVLTLQPKTNTLRVVGIESTHKKALVLARKDSAQSKREVDYVIIPYYTSEVTCQILKAGKMVKDGGITTQVATETGTPAEFAKKIEDVLKDPPKFPGLSLADIATPLNELVTPTVVHKEYLTANPGSTKLFSGLKHKQTRKTTK